MSTKASSSNQITSSIRYFASSNSGEGFISYFDKIFDISKFERVIILKGGPGTGKSSFMKKTRDLARRYNTPYDEILCSSDPDSLDGIIIRSNKGNIAILDGTSPHTLDPKIPGVIDELIDLGKYWDQKRLLTSKEEIISLQKLKSDSYKNAYAILSAAKTCLKRKQDLLSECIIRDKLDKAITRLIPSKHSNKNKQETIYRINNAISAKGPFSCDLYNEQLTNSIPVFGVHGAAFYIIKAIADRAFCNNYSSWISPSPLQPKIIDGIFIEDVGLSFYDAGKYSPICDDKKCKCINSERFLDQKMLKEIKPILRNLSQLYEVTMKNAYIQLSKSKNYHFQLEKIYTHAMDFSKIEKEESYIKDIVKAFCV